jgi:biotin carboxyl carrier protein
MSLTRAEEAIEADHDGEGAHSPVRLVVAPTAGRFVSLTPEVQPQAGDIVVAGQPVGLVEMARTQVEARSAFSGVLVGMLAVEGQRVRPDQPIAWLQPYTPEAGAP